MDGTRSCNEVDLVGFRSAGGCLAASAFVGTPIRFCWKGSAVQTDPLSSSAVMIYPVLLERLCGAGGSSNRFCCDDLSGSAGKALRCRRIPYPALL
ncbi:hypothetical protein NDU88_004678 [Pleurodeles waltl]|uniref:Uncharacterized protein n=1 Tax=Pleurodeles waltl TaxID=8319 RepID=A0AAV7TTD8_PLEWA|nr:hypothetical protein NDU88_004678 [Pleurodeles waltl]